MFGGMKAAPLPAAELTGYVDKLDAAWIAEVGTSASGLGLGEAQHLFGGASNQ